MQSMLCWIVEPPIRLQMGNYRILNLQAHYVTKDSNIPDNVHVNKIHSTYTLLCQPRPVVDF